jgi:hypothetical protein
MDSINPMMYRVFLRDALTTDKGFQINYANILAWTHTDPGYRPNLEKQLRQSTTRDCFTVRPLEKAEDGQEHWLVKDKLLFHDFGRAMDKAYELAREEALTLTKQLSEKRGEPYVFIDVSSRGNKEEAERLSKIVHNERVAVGSS